VRGKKGEGEKTHRISVGESQHRHLSPTEEEKKKVGNASGMVLRGNRQPGGRGPLCNWDVIKGDGHITKNPGGGGSVCNWNYSKAGTDAAT